MILTFSKFSSDAWDKDYGSNLVASKEARFWSRLLRLLRSECGDDVDFETWVKDQYGIEFLESDVNPGLISGIKIPDANLTLLRLKLPFEQE